MAQDKKRFAFKDLKDNPKWGISKLKREIEISSFAVDDLASRFSTFSGMRLFILDANILLSLASGRDGDLDPIRRILERWKSIKSFGVCCVPDFVMLEALNAKKYMIDDENVKVKEFMEKIEHSEEAFYIYLKTPVKGIRADSRAKFINYLPKRDRRVILSYYSDEKSGTDQAVLTLASILKSHGLSVVVVSKDEKLRTAAEEMNLHFYPQLKRKSIPKRCSSNIRSAKRVRSLSMMPHRKMRFRV